MSHAYKILRITRANQQAKRTIYIVFFKKDIRQTCSAASSDIINTGEIWQVRMLEYMAQTRRFRQRHLCWSWVLRTCVRPLLLSQHPASRTWYLQVIAEAQPRWWLLANCASSWRTSSAFCSLSSSGWGGFVVPLRSWAENSQTPGFQFSVLIGRISMTWELADSK